MTRGILLRGIVAALALLGGAPPPPPVVSLASHNGTLRIAVVGDVGYGTDRVAAGIAKIGANNALNAIIIPGDNVYPCGVRERDDPRWRVLEPLTRFNVPIFPVLGNHDYCGNADAEINAALPNWNFPAKQYAIRSDVADFAMIDTMPYVNGGKPPAIAFGATKKWRIVVGHHPIVSSGYHGYFPRRDVHRMRQLLPALRAEKVDLYICGHDHHQELVEGHPRFLVSGAGSEPVPIFILRGASIFPTNVPFREPIGFTLLEITRDTLSITFYDQHARKRGGPMITER